MYLVEKIFVKNIWFFGDSFITLKTIQRGVLLTYGLAL